MVFLYLSTVIPSVWFLELNLLQSNLPINSSTNSDPQFFSQIPLTMVGGKQSLTIKLWLDRKKKFSFKKITQELSLCCVVCSSTHIYGKALNIKHLFCQNWWIHRKQTVFCKMPAIMGKKRIHKIRSGRKLRFTFDLWALHKKHKPTH